MITSKPICSFFIPWNIAIWYKGVLNIYQDFFTHSSSIKHNRTWLEEGLVAYLSTYL